MHAVFDNHAKYQIFGIFAKSINNCFRMRIFENIQSLLLENELLIIENRVRQLRSSVVRYGIDFVGQSLGNDTLSRSSTNAVWRKDFEFRIIGKMTAGAGNKQDAPFTREVH